MECSGVPVTLSRQTQYPDDGEIELRVRVAHPTQFALHLGIPGWVESSGKISINS